MDNCWKGRTDGEDNEHHRIFQRVEVKSEYSIINQDDFILHGFAVDEGVRRNKGRVGARKAPDVIRQNMANFPVFSDQFKLLDFGNVYCENGNLEEAQNNLSKKIKLALSKQAKSVVLGGGHEITYAHFQGIRNAFPQSKIGIINFDAHFDNRKVNPNVGASSGTGFYQIAEKEAINSLHIGIQRNSNTKALFNYADKMDMKYIYAENLLPSNKTAIINQIDELIEKVNVLYVTICMDVFNAAIAPGVSALAYNGIFADAFLLSIYRYILRHPKVVALDVAEVNPKYDCQNRTARLAASLINEWFLINE